MSCFIDKGTHCENCHNKNDSSHFSGYQTDLMPGPFELNLSRYFKIYIAKTSVGTESKTACMKLKS